MDAIGNIKIQILPEDLSQLCTKKKWLMSRAHTEKKQTTTRVLVNNLSFWEAVTPTYISGFKVHSLRMICL